MQLNLLLMVTTSTCKIQCRLLRVRIRLDIAADNVVSAQPQAVTVAIDITYGPAHLRLQVTVPVTYAFRGLMRAIAAKIRLWEHWQNYLPKVPDPVPLLGQPRPLRRRTYCHVWVRLPVVLGRPRSSPA